MPGQCQVVSLNATSSTIQLADRQLAASNVFSVRDGCSPTIQLVASNAIEYAKMLSDDTTCVQECFNRTVRQRWRGCGFACDHPC